MTDDVWAINMSTNCIEFFVFALLQDMEYLLDYNYFEIIANIFFKINSNPRK